MVLALAWLAAALPAHAARLALVIGIDNYDMIPPLQKAVGDAQAMSKRLTDLGFSVTTVIDPDRRQFNQAIAEFRASLHGGDTAFVDFSGHGVELNGHDLLLPRDIPLPVVGDQQFLMDEAIDLSDLMQRVEQSGAAVRIFVVDACRDNPFAQSGVRGLAGPGLGPPPPSQGSFVLYSAGYSQVALDRLGPDDQSATSVYTRILLRKLATPGLSISEIARSVRSEVASLAGTIGYVQAPAYYDGLTDDYVLSPVIPGAVEAAPANVEAAAFDRARDLGTVDALEAFLSNYPKGVFADLARVALLTLKPSADLSAKNAGDAVEAFSIRQRLKQLWDEGHQFDSEGNYAMYVQRTTEARLLAAASFGTNSVEYADASNQVVGAFGSVGQLAEAMAASRDAIRVYSALFGDLDPRVLNEKANLAARLGATGHTSEAAEMFNELLAGYSSIDLSGSMEVDYAHALEGHARFGMRTGDMATAERDAAKAVAILEGAGNTKSLDYGWVAETYAQVLKQDGKCTEAQDMFARAAQGMKSANISETQRDYADILSSIRQGCS